MTRRAVPSSGRCRRATRAVALVLACGAWTAGAGLGRADSLADRNAPGAAAPPTTARAIDARVARLADELADHVLHLRLDDYDVPGWRGGGVVPVTQAVLDSDRAFRAEAARSLEALERAAAGVPVEPSRRVDLALMAAQLERSRIDRDELRRFETDPGRIWPRVDGSIRSLLGGRPGAVCRRLVLMTRRLRPVPEAVRAMRVILDRPSRLAVESAITAFERTLVLYRSDLPAAILECRDPAVVADLSEADTLATRSIKAFTTWLADEALTRADGSWSMGPEVYARWLRATTGDTTALEPLAARAERELASAASDAAGASPRADSARAAMADSMLAARAERAGRSASSRLRTVLGRRELALPWASFAMRLGAIGAAPAAPATAPRFAPTRLDLAGMRAEIGLHARGQSFDTARLGLMRDASLDSAAADAETRVAALAPVRAAAVVTAWQLESAREQAAETLGRRFSSRAFLDASIEAGAVPVATIREVLLGQVRGNDGHRARSR